MMLASRTASCQKWPPAPSVFPLQSGKSRSQAAFCKRLVRDEIAPEKGSPAVTKLESTWKSVNNAADLALKGEKLVQLGQKA
jgi:hypothetical protein